MGLSILIKSHIEPRNKVHRAMDIACILIPHKTVKRIFKVILDNGAVIGFKEMIPRRTKLLHLALEKLFNVTRVIRNFGKRRNIAKRGMDIDNLGSKGG